MGRNAAGVRGISLNGNEEVIGVTIVTEDRTQILAITEKGYGKQTSVDEYRLQGRGGKGVKTIHVTAKNGNLKKLISVVGDEDLLVVTDKGMIIRVPIDQIAQTKRATQGVKIINLLEGHVVSTIAMVPKEELIDDDEAEIEDKELPEETIPVVHSLEPLEKTSGYQELTDFDNDVDSDDAEDENEDDEINDILSDSY
jgi:DNA gyrase subunit A